MSFINYDELRLSVVWVHFFLSNSTPDIKLVKPECRKVLYQYMKDDEMTTSTAIIVIYYRKQWYLTRRFPALMIAHRNNHF